VSLQATAIVLGVKDVEHAKKFYRVDDRAAQVHEAVGVSGESILRSFLSDVRPFRIYDGPSVVHRWAIARRLVRDAREVAAA
jgi:acyl-CoA dehydrogenase